MLEELKKAVYISNLELVKQGLVIHTWGNVSGRDRETGLVVIKPSGVSYGDMKEEDMVVTDCEGHIAEGRLKPSTDLPTHLFLYRTYNEIGGIVHTHSTYATAWAQAGLPVPPLGTTHADHFYGEVPCSRMLTDAEIEGDYETSTGRVLVEALGLRDPLSVPAVLASGHGPFSWGKDAAEAVYNAVALEEIAKMALFTFMLGKTGPLKDSLLRKHFLRKHGSSAYYGQK
jgi:L-ribulose-5-phosphate 4-epimerase